MVHCTALHLHGGVWLVGGVVDDDNDDGEGRKGARLFRGSDTRLLGITWRLLSQAPAVSPATCRVAPAYHRPADARSVITPATN